MGELLLVDTDILIDAGRGIEAAAEYLSTQQFAISVVTQMELIVGCRNKIELGHLEQYLKSFTILNLDTLIADLAVELLQQYRLSHGLLIPDALIAATVIRYGASLVSKNQKDYRYIDKLQLIPYPPTK